MQPAWVLCVKHVQGGQTMCETGIPSPEQEARANYERLLAETRKLDAEADRLLAEERKLAAEELLLRRQRRATEINPVIYSLKAGLSAAVIGGALTYILFGVLL